MANFSINTKSGNTMNISSLNPKIFDKSITTIATDDEILLQELEGGAQGIQKRAI